MLPLDLEQFWKDDAIAHQDNCFCKNSPQIALGIRMSDECVYAELGEKGDPWGIEDPLRRVELNKRYNDKAEKIVGIRLLSEALPDVKAQFPQIKRIGEVFGGTYSYIENGGEWLESPIKSTSALESKLDEIDRMDLREFMLPANWESEKKRIYEYSGKRPNLLRHIRGPVTLATSIFGEANFLFLYYDAPELFKRFSDTIKRVIIEMAEIMDVEAGFAIGHAPRGFSFADDNCCLLTPDMYEMFGYPVLKSVFERFSPDENDSRYQHSDSPMAHLLPVLSRLNLTGCNFGPTVLVDEIRKYMPNTRIDGCIAPFTFMNNDSEKIIQEVRRDCDMIKGTGTKGLNLTTAGSINNGSSLESMRLIMQVIQNYGRYMD